MSAIPQTKEIVHTYQFYTPLVAKVERLITRLHDYYTPDMFSKDVDEVGKMIKEMKF